MMYNKFSIHCNLVFPCNVEFAELPNMFGQCRNNFDGSHTVVLNKKRILERNTVLFYREALLGTYFHETAHAALSEIEPELFELEVHESVADLVSVVLLRKDNMVIPPIRKEHFKYFGGNTEIRRTLNVLSHLGIDADDEEVVSAYTALAF